MKHNPQRYSPADSELARAQGQIGLTGVLPGRGYRVTAKREPSQFVMKGRSLPSMGNCRSRPKRVIEEEFQKLSLKRSTRMMLRELLTHSESV